MYLSTVKYSRVLYNCRFKLREYYLLKEACKVFSSRDQFVEYMNNKTWQFEYCLLTANWFVFSLFLLVPVNLFKISQVLIGLSFAATSYDSSSLQPTRSFSFGAKLHFVFKVILSLSMASTEPWNMTYISSVAKDPWFVYPSPHQKETIQCY